MTADWDYVCFQVHGAHIWRVRRLPDGRFQADLTEGDALVLDPAAVRAFADAMAASENTTRARGLDALIPVRHCSRCPGTDDVREVAGDVPLCARCRMAEEGLIPESLPEEIR